MRISAYIPCYNNAANLAGAIASIRAQTIPVDELFVVDDGSTDNSAEIATQLEVEVLRESVNHGRGYTRHRAMKRAKGEFVLCLDATNVLPQDFLAKALLWFDDHKVAAVYGRIVEQRRKTVAERWRAHHLFKNDTRILSRRRAGLITYGTVVRRKTIEEVGGFSPTLRHSEDHELGERLLSAGHDVVYDSNLYVASQSNNSVLEVLERYWRWYAGHHETFSLTAYSRHAWYCLHNMARRDLRKRDYASAIVSITLPIYLLAKTMGRRFASTNQNFPVTHNEA